MKKVLITESQAKLLMEEIDRNDTIQKLVFSEPSSIKFVITSQIPDGVRLFPVVDGKKVDSKYVGIFAKKLTVGDAKCLQLHINVAPELRRLGIAEKMFTAILNEGYRVCQLNSETDPAVQALWNKIASNGMFEVKNIQNNAGKKIGTVAYLRR